MCIFLLSLAYLWGKNWITIESWRQGAAFNHRGRQRVGTGSPLLCALNVKSRFHHVEIAASITIPLAACLWTNQNISYTFHSMGNIPLFFSSISYIHIDFLRVKVWTCCHCGRCFLVAEFMRVHLETPTNFASIHPFFFFFLQVKCSLWDGRFALSASPRRHDIMKYNGMKGRRY